MEKWSGVVLNAGLINVCDLKSSSAFRQKAMSWVSRLLL